MQKNLWVYVVIAVCIGTCGADTVEGSFVHGETMRSYVVYTPDSDPGPDGYALVVGLHGTGASGEQFLLTTAIPLLAEREGLIVVCPDAIQFENYTYFNAGGPFEDQKHEWPRLTSLQISATNVIWNFMKDYSRN